MPCVCAGSIPEELGGLVRLEQLRLDLNKLAGDGVCSPVGLSLLGGPETVLGAGTGGFPTGGPIGDLAFTC